jgi:cell division protein FtsB
MLDSHAIKAVWEDIIDGGATKEQTEYIAETARYKYNSLIYESD